MKLRSGPGSKKLSEYQTAYQVTGYIFSLCARQGSSGQKIESIILKNLFGDMKMFVFCFLSLLTGVCFAQDNYLILHKGDTIYGKRIVVGHKRTYIRTPEGKLKFPTPEVREYRTSRARYMVFKNPFVNTYYDYRVEVDGPVRLLRDRGADDVNVRCSDYVFIEGRFLPIIEAYMSDEIWDIMAQCEAYREKYEDRKVKRLFMNMPSCASSGKRWWNFTMQTAQMETRHPRPGKNK